MAVSRTIGPLHFEDLEPHRFEDLVRQLAYGFRTWTLLEATGRLGNDEGVDIRGIEGGPAIRNPTDDLVDPQEYVDVDDELRPEREWRIQCKRYKSLPPREMKRIVADLVPDPAHAPHGLVVAASCDVSGAAMRVFHDEAVRLGVREHVLWTKAHIEDMLFRPEYDHLLFAYFGISLRVRRTSQLQEVRSRISLKRKLVNLFSAESLLDHVFQEAIVRDVAYDGALSMGQVPEYASLAFPPWHKVWVAGFHPMGLVVQTHRYDGRLLDDGRWDILERTETVRDEPNFEERARLEGIPEGEQVSIIRELVLPYENLLEVDPFGDIPFDEEVHQLPPHLYCYFASAETGPYALAHDDQGLADWWQAKPRAKPYADWVELEPGKRAPLF